jgi:hypothetical protein
MPAPSSHINHRHTDRDLYLDLPTLDLAALLWAHRTGINKDDPQVLYCCRFENSPVFLLSYSISSRCVAARDFSLYSTVYNRGLSHFQRVGEYK